MGSRCHQMKGIGITLWLAVLSVRPGWVATVNPMTAVPLSHRYWHCCFHLACRLYLVDWTYLMLQQDQLLMNLCPFCHMLMQPVIVPKLIDIAAGKDFEELTLLEMATSHDKYQAEIKLAIYNKIQIKLNGRLVSTGDHSGNKHGVVALKSMLQELLKHWRVILTMTEIVSVMGGFKGDMCNHLVTVFLQKLAMSKIKKPDMIENFVKVWKVFWLV
jgi:hypothetical protein